MKYKRCVLCEVNYVENTEEICKMCKSGKSADNGESLDFDVCPYCEKNYLKFGEEKCINCLNKANLVAKFNKTL